MSGGTNWGNIGVGTQIPVSGKIGMAADDAPEEHDLLVLNASGDGVTSDGSQANARMLGVCFPGKRSDANPVAGGNVVQYWNGYGARMPMSGDANDSFVANDRISPAYISDAKEIGKLPAASGVGRPLAGLFVEMDGDKPVFWLGDIAQLIARSLVIAGNFKFAAYNIADAAASTVTAERAIGRVTEHGYVTSIAYDGAALAASNTDYATGTIAKRSALDSYASATTIATFDTRTSGTGAAAAFTPYAWALSATAANLRLVPGDVITLVTTKSGAGQQLIGNIDVRGKVI